MNWAIMILGMAMIDQEIRLILPKLVQVTSTILVSIMLTHIHQNFGSTHKRKNFEEG